MQGFRASQLNLKKKLPTPASHNSRRVPTDLTANTPYRGKPYRLHDVSYYKGRLYLYFGATPALILFWPYVTLTGHYLFHRQAVAIFCAIGFFGGCWFGLLTSGDATLPEVNGSAWLQLSVLALGLSTGRTGAALAVRSVYEVSISLWIYARSCWRSRRLAMRGAGLERRRRWLAIASAMFGLAVGARPSLLYHAVILLIPVAPAGRGATADLDSSSRRMTHAIVFISGWE